MNVYHKELAAGYWQQLTFLEQMANVGSEVERALNWKIKKNTVYAQKAFERALELLDLTLADSRNRNRLRELARVREAWVDFFCEFGFYVTAEAAWRKYFLGFTYAARRNC